MVPVYSIKFVKEKRYLAAKPGDYLHLSLGTQEGLFIETFLRDRKPYSSLIDEWIRDEVTLVYAIPFKYINEKKIPLYPVFYSASLDTPELYDVQREKNYSISWYKLLPEMEVYIPEGYKIPLDACVEIKSYKEMIKLLSEYFKSLQVDRYITGVMYKLFKKKARWYGGYDYELPHPTELTPEEKKLVEVACNIWNNFVSDITGVPVPPRVNEITLDNYREILGLKPKQSQQTGKKERDYTLLIIVSAIAGAGILVGLNHYIKTTTKTS